MQENSGSQGSVNSRLLQAAKQGRKRPRVSAPNALPEPEPEPLQKRSRWQLPVIPGVNLPPKQSAEAPAVPSSIQRRSSKAPVAQKRGNAGQGKAPISKGKLVISDSPKESSNRQKRNRRNPPPRKLKKQPPALSTSPSLSPAKSEEYSTPRICMRCKSCRKSQRNPRPRSAQLQEESADNLSAFSDIGSSNVHYVKEEESVNWNGSPVRLQEQTHTYPNRRPMKYSDYINYIKAKSRRLLAARDSS